MTYTALSRDPHHIPRKCGLHYNIVVYTRQKSDASKRGVVGNTQRLKTLSPSCTSPTTTFLLLVFTSLLHMAEITGFIATASSQPSRSPGRGKKTQKLGKTTSVRWLHPSLTKHSHYSCHGSSRSLQNSCVVRSRLRSP